MKPRHLILEGSFPYLSGLCSIVYKKGYAIIARYGVNKTTLRKILNAYFKKLT